MLPIGSRLVLALVAIQFCRCTADSNSGDYTITYYPNSAMSGWHHINLTGVNKIEFSVQPIRPINLRFKFPLGGHEWDSIGISQYGYLYVGKVETREEKYHIMPFKCLYFSYSQIDEQLIYYYDSGTSFTVHWSNMRIAGFQSRYSFEAVVYSNGDIMFLYDDLPLTISELASNKKYVSVGVSSNILVSVGYYVSQLTEIGEKSSIYFKSKPMCDKLYSCDDCAKSPADRNCLWCSSISKCIALADYQQSFGSCYYPKSGCMDPHPVVDSTTLGQIDTTTPRSTDAPEWRHITFLTNVSLPAEAINATSISIIISKNTANNLTQDVSSALIDDIATTQHQARLVLALLMLSFIIGVLIILALTFAIGNQVSKWRKNNMFLKTMVLDDN